MTRLAPSLSLCALLLMTGLARADAIERTTTLQMLHGPNATECAAATSDYERYELGCPLDDAAVGPTASADHPLD